MSIVIRNDSQLFFIYLISLWPVYPYSVKSCLSVFSKEEQCQCSGTWVCSDHRTDIGYRDPVISESLFNNRSKFLSIRFASSVIAAFLPLTLLTLIRCPSSSTCRIGLIESIVPTVAVTPDIRPPLFKKKRSSTVPQLHSFNLISSIYCAFSSRLFP